jgi:hypothetical protein
VKIGAYSAEALEPVALASHCPATYQSYREKLGSIYLEQQKFTNAAMEFETALRLNPGLWEGNASRDRGYRSSSRFSELTQEDCDVCRVSLSGAEVVLSDMAD